MPVSSSPHPLGTPYLRVDVARLLANISSVAQWALRLGVAVRPHVKTHKSPTIAQLQVASGARGVTVATLGEAEVFARHGFSDIFIGYPLWLDDDRAARLRPLLDNGAVAIGVDSVDGIGQAARRFGRSLEVMVEVDSGHHRTGVAAGRAGQLAATAARAGLGVRGIFTFPGHSYAADGLRAAARDEGSALVEAAASLVKAGVEPRVVSGGSTPSLDHTITRGLTEVRPGVYVFGDAQQWELGSMRPEQLALTCRSTVVSRSEERVVLDAGSKILGADRAPYATGYGRLRDHPDARIVSLSEHHAVVKWVDEPLPAIGSQVEVVPNHVCSAVNLVDTLWADDGGGLRAWPVAARGRNS